MTDDPPCAICGSGDCHGHFQAPRRSVFFDGETYHPAQDKFRLLTELQRVWVVMLDGGWRSLETLAAATGGSEAGVSARLRDFRKPRFGKHQVERKRVQGGYWQYRLTPNGPLLCPDPRGTKRVDREFRLT